MHYRRFAVYSLVAFLACATNPGSAQIITTIAGNGTVGDTGDGGLATAAEVNAFAVVVDTAHNVYITNPGTFVVRRIAPPGIITTFAGTGIRGHSGDGGPATAARLSNVGGIARDVRGNMYISEPSGGADSSYIRRIDTAGIITTIAGTGPGGYSGDGGPATAAQIFNPEGIVVDHAGNIYFSDYQNNRVRKIDTAGIISTFAGTGAPGCGGDGGPATVAEAEGVQQVAVDAMGNIYLADEPCQRIRKVDTAGIITTVAGTGIPGYAGDHGPATLAELNYPRGIAFDAAGNMYISETSNIRKVDIAGIITTIAGGDTSGYGGDGGCATAALLNFPCYLSTDAAGNVYVPDYYNNRLRRISRDRPPAFTGGHSQAVAICQGAIAALDTLLAVMDSDAAKTDDWTAVTLPTHGAVSAAYTTTTTGGVLVPAGLTYTPASGFAGADSFSVAVNDCANGNDTTTLYVRVDSFPVAGSITGADTVCMGSFTVLADAAAAGVWHSSNSNASVATGVVTGDIAGTDTITYIVTNACGTVSAMHVVTVDACPSGVAASRVSDETIQLLPNPNTGTFTVNISSDVNEAVQLTITNAVGEVVRQLATVTNHINDIFLNVPAGIYFLHAASASGIWSSRVTVAR